MKKWLKKIMKKVSRGFSIMEVVIAMTVIAVCTATTIAVLERSRNVSSKAFYYYEARELVDNTLEVFKYADNEEQFFNGLGYLDQQYTKEGHLYYYENNLYRIEVTVVFNEYHNGMSTFRAVGYQSNGHQLFTCSYDMR
ncbi:MAG: prepilin-type N-terminal cleavage/methylation domain-containing protein [Bacilli bacterium]|nr:prepilin-type N-terminal cleavage/methylation domain-containing protein [Bacilli bacterium]